MAIAKCKECGGDQIVCEARFIYGIESHVVKCGNEDCPLVVVIGGYSTLDRAIAAWNKRNCETEGC